jgi:hypothetical protein
MICKITFWFAPQLKFTVNDVRFYTHPHGTYEGHVKFLNVSNSISGGFTIQGSLAKYFNGENITYMDRVKVERAIEMLERDSGISFENAIIRNLEFGATFLVHEPPSEYLCLLGHPPIYTRIEYSNARNGLVGIDVLETVRYDSKKGSFAFCIYDKVKAMKGKNIPEIYKDKNLLRLEYRLKKRPAILAKFHRDLTCYDLFDPKVYMRLMELFVQFYFNIPKTGNQLLFTSSERVTPALAIKMYAESQRQNDPKGFINFMQHFVDSRKMSQKDLDMVNAIEWKTDKIYSYCPTNDRIDELNNCMNGILRMSNF